MPNSFTLPLNPQIHLHTYTNHTKQPQDTAIIPTQTNYLPKGLWSLLTVVIFIASMKYTLTVTLWSGMSSSHISPVVSTAYR